MATKIFSHAVIWNGEIVPANTPIEIKEEKPVKQEAKVEVEETPKKRGAK